MEKIGIRDLWFKYPLGERQALSGISLSVREGEFLVVCGKSGCGKSTLLRHMKKSLLPYGEMRGELLFCGRPLDEMDLREDAGRIGFVQQNPDNQLVTDKVWHELAFGLENLGLDNRVIKRRVAEMASYFGIQGWFRKSVAELSGGQKQLLNLASVMAMQPEVLILDEPASQLDPIAAGELLSTVYRINRDLGVTVVISEHRLEDVFPMADRVVVLDSGRILAEGTPSEVASDLAVIDGGKPHPMYLGMPAVMRSFPEDLAAGKGSEEPGGLPLTVREGRLILEKLLNGRSAESVSASAQADRVRRAQKEPPETALSMKNVWFCYEKGGEDVLRGLDLTVRKGELYCLLGGNGTGKSTTLKAVTGIVRPQKGKISVKDGLVTAMVPQNPQALFTEISCEEEIFEGMAYLKMSDEEKLARTEQMLSLMEIEHLRKANPYDLSGGEQQRLAIGKVMAYGPDLLLLDEPTKGLDPFFKATLGKILKGLTAKGVTVFMVSHDIEFCAEYGDTCAMFFDGGITAEGGSRDFFSGNNFYTTAANRLVRRWRPDLVLPEEVKDWLRQIL